MNGFGARLCSGFCFHFYVRFGYWCLDLLCGFGCLGGFRSFPCQAFGLALTATDLTGIVRCAARAWSDRCGWLLQSGLRSFGSSFGRRCSGGFLGRLGCR
ncbi:hypothetical protein BZL42_03930, partial [Pseudomonas indica]